MGEITEKKIDTNKELKKALNEASKNIEIKKENDFTILQNNAEQLFYESIRGYVPHKKYDEIFKCVNVILDSKKLNGMVIDGSFGIGKSTIIKGYLKQNNKNFYYINSYTTSLSFYIMIYNHKDDIIIVDDLSGVWADDKGISILRALLNTDEVRYIKYESTSDKLSVPNQFIFNGKIIILCNKANSHLDESALSRVIYRNLNFTLAEKKDMIKGILKEGYDLNDDSINIITQFIDEKVDECVTSFSFRTLLKITEFYLKYPSEWKELSLKEIPKDESMALMKELINKSHLSTKERINEFVTETGKSRATYFNYLKRYKQLV